jgi:hypothetical protein
MGVKEQAKKYLKNITELFFFAEILFCSKIGLYICHSIVTLKKIQLMHFLLTTGIAKNFDPNFLPNGKFGTILARERERERERQAYIIFTCHTCTCTRARVKNNKNKTFKLYSPVVVFIGKTTKRDFFHTQKHHQTGIAGVNLHRPTDCVVSLREEHALCNPPFLCKVRTDAAIGSVPLPHRTKNGWSKS